MHEQPSQRTVDDRKLTPTQERGIYKRGNSYVVRFRDPQGKDRKRYARTLAEARAIKAETKADISRGEYRATSKVTFNAYATDWLQTYSGRTSRGVRESTMAEYRRAIEQRAIPHFGKRPLASIEPRDVKAYLAWVSEQRARSGDPLARNTVRLALAPLRALFATAVEEGVIRVNPCTGVRLPRPLDDDQDDEQAVKALTDEELRALLGHVKAEYALLTRLMAETGLRVGEAIALQGKHLELGRQRILVQRRLYEGKFAPPKSKYGRREVPISKSLARALWQQFAAVEPDALLFPGRDGKPMRSSTVLRAVKAAGKAAGVPWAGCHTLRHTSATRLFKAGWNAKQVQLALGHHSPAFTLNVYVHLLADDLPSPDALALDPVGATDGATEATETGVSADLAATTS